MYTFLSFVHLRLRIRILAHFVSVYQQLSLWEYGKDFWEAAVMLIEFAYCSANTTPGHSQCMLLQLKV